MAVWYLKPRDCLELLGARGSSGCSQPAAARCGDVRPPARGEPLYAGAGAWRSIPEPFRVGPGRRRQPSPALADACPRGPRCGSARWRWRAPVGREEPPSSLGPMCTVRPRPPPSLLVTLRPGWWWYDTPVHGMVRRTGVVGRRRGDNSASPLLVLRPQRLRPQGSSKTSSWFLSINLCRR